MPYSQKPQMSTSMTAMHNSTSTTDMTSAATMATTPPLTQSSTLSGFQSMWQSGDKVAPYFTSMPTSRLDSDAPSDDSNDRPASPASSARPMKSVALKMAGTTVVNELIS